MNSPKIAQGADESCTLVSDLLVREEDVEVASRSLKAISHPLRLKILCVLGENEVSVQDIVECVGTSQSNISQHLAILRDKGILASRKEANRVFYRVGDARTLKLIGMMQEITRIVVDVREDKEVTSGIIKGARTYYVIAVTTKNRSLLKKKGVDYTEISVGRDRDLWDEMEQRSGRNTVPQIFINDESVGGYDDIAALDRQGELDQKLGIRVYVKDISFESPNSPAIFTQDWEPDTNLNLNTQVNPLGEDHYEVELHLTVSVKGKDGKTAFLVEVVQAGAFLIKATQLSN
ncbi:Protein-export protein SecB [Nymphon striatum]|nr:Protein-export protein SecB [Nymphon striatum]